MFRHICAHMRGSRLAQAGVALVVFSGLTETMDQLGALDLTNVPLLGKYAPVILATAGVLKVVFRLVVFLLTGLGVKTPAEDPQ